MSGKINDQRCARVHRLSPHGQAGVRGVFAVLLLATLLAPAGCGASGGTSTRMTADDLHELAAQMAQKLAASDALKQRGPDSEPWVVSFDKALNLSSDLITDSERWYVVHKVQSSLPLQALSQQKNLTFVMPAERLRALRRDPNLDIAADPNFGAQRRPTHQMTATFRSITRADALNRTEAYYIEFELLDLRSGEPEWIDKFEYKRAATGHIWD